jgi:hypothetical protein
MSINKVPMNDEFTPILENEERSLLTFKNVQLDFEVFIKGSLILIFLE